MFIYVLSLYVSHVMSHVCAIKYANKYGKYWSIASGKYQPNIVIDLCITVYSFVHWEEHIVQEEFK